jgi:hypothetical protein
MTSARWIFRIAGIYGVLVIAPLYFLERLINANQPPPITHPEYFYGFAGVTLVWQLVFLLISSDPVRYRPMMPLAMLEKIAWAVAIPILYFQGRVEPILLAGAAGDAVLLVLFVLAYARSRAADAPSDATRR